MEYVPDLQPSVQCGHLENTCFITRNLGLQPGCVPFQKQVRGRRHLAYRQTGHTGAGTQGITTTTRSHSSTITHPFCIAKEEGSQVNVMAPWGDHKTEFNLKNNKKQYCNHLLCVLCCSHLLYPFCIDCVDVSIVQWSLQRGPRCEHVPPSSTVQQQTDPCSPFKTGVEPATLDLLDHSLSDLPTVMLLRVLELWFQKLCRSEVLDLQFQKLDSRAEVPQQSFYK